MKNPEELVQKYGGKAASLVMQYEAGNTDMLFPFTLVDAKDFETNKPSFNFKNKQIARGSAAGDEKGLVDVISTEQNLNSEHLNDLWEYDYALFSPELHEVEDIRKGKNPYFDELKEQYDDLLKGKMTMGDYFKLIEELGRKKAEDFGLTHNPSVIGDIIEQSKEQEVIDYARWEGLQDYDGVKFVIVQPQNQHRDEIANYYVYKRGSIVEHPNIKDHYLINFVQISNRIGEKDTDTCIFQVLADEQGRVIVSKGMDMGNDTIKQIVDMKKRSREAGFIPSEYSSQVEFGFLGDQDLESEKYMFSTSPTNPVIFYQERRFLPFDFDEGIRPDNYKFNQFGRLPENGIELRVVKLGEIADESVITDGVPSVYVFDDRSIHQGLPLGFQPNNMHAMMVPGGIVTEAGNSLEHKTYRWVQKAKISDLTYAEKYNNYTDGEIIKIKR